MLPFSLALAAVPLLASIAQAAPASGVVLKREALVQSIEADLRTRGWTDDRVNELEVEALKADILTLAAEKRLFGWGEDDSSDEGYAPVKTTCEANTNFVRAADSLNDVEKAHIQTRLNPNRFLTYLSSINVDPSALNLNLTSSSSTNSTPNVGLAYSGGGYRAMVNGGGNFYALDSRNSEANDAGTGQIGQLASYITGLSGGSWMVGSMMSWSANGNASMLEIAQKQWNLSSNLVIPDGNLIDRAKYFADLLAAVSKKKDEGFAGQITDYWGLALSDHLFPPQYGPTETPNLTMSDLKGVNPEDVPYPIIVAAEREEGEISVAENATVWEFSYEEFGTWGFGGGVSRDQSRNSGGAFTPTRYLGTPLNNGTPNSTDDKKCYTGFDNLGFVVGTSSTLFNAAYASLANSSGESLIASAVESILGAISKAGNDIAAVPNPFIGWQPETNPAANFPEITLVDAGLTNQNIPYEPLLIPIRGVDAILSFDNSADTTYSWPNGSAPTTTYRRLQTLTDELGIDPLFPQMPANTNSWVNLGLNTHPTFFGCDTNARPNTTTPIVVYIPNYPWSTFSNVSTYQLEWEQNQVDSVFMNAVRSVTLNNTVDGWSTCLACALADRAVARGGQERSQACRDCFGRWCWNGTIDDSEPAGEYDPVPGTLPTFLANLGATAKAAATGLVPASPSTASTSTNGSGSAGFSTASVGSIGAAFAVVLSSAVALLG